MSKGLQEYGISSEAAEAPNIFANRIERIAALVQQKLLAEHDDQSSKAKDQQVEAWIEPSLDAEVETMDRLRRRNDLRSERLTRRIAEATAAGLPTDAAFELAMREEGLPVPTCEPDELDEFVPSETWGEGQSPSTFDEASERSLIFDQPGVAEARAFLTQVMNLEKSDLQQSSFASLLKRACLDMVGGLVQATSGETDDVIDRALTISQLKRALSAHAYARGALFGMHSEQTITKAESKQFQEQLEKLLEIIHELSEAAWFPK